MPKVAKKAKMEEKAVKQAPLFYRQNFYTNKVVFIDGISRTGKSMLGPILSSFKNVEIERIEPILEIIPLLEHYGKIDRQTAITLLRQELDMRFYDTMISRNTNFRLTDHTGVRNSSKVWEYVKRLFREEGDAVIARIKKENVIFQNQMHDLLGHCQLYFAVLEERLRILEVVRHPVDVISSFYKRGWGERYGTDPRNFTLTINYNDGQQDHALPWYAHGWEKEYLMMSPMDRVIEFLWVLTQRNKKGFVSLTKEQQQQILFIPFELFVVNPHVYLPQIETFVGTMMGPKTAKALKRERCPRVLDVSQRNEKLENIRKFASEKSYQKLLSLIQDYEQHYLSWANEIS